LLAGCLEGPAPKDRPADWDQGTELVFISGFRAHSADEERQIVPPTNATLATPAYCAAYQDGFRDFGDSCTVISPYGPMYWEESWDWGIEASWNGRGEDLIEQERETSHRTVVAFDAEGAPVAYWDTASHPNAAMAIE
jgi:hypothetical protein